MISSLQLQRKTLILHPALEVRSDIASVGLRRYFFKDGSVTTQNNYFLSDSERILELNQQVNDLPFGSIVFLPKTLPFDTIYFEHLSEWVKNPVAQNPTKLYEEIKGIIRKYIELQEEAYGLISSWILCTYFNPAFPCFPYLAFIGQKATGKTNMLELLSYLAFNAVKASLTMASLGDTADALRGTIIIDQANHINDDLNAVLVDSYKRGAGKRRITDITNKGRNLLEFDCYCPKVFASHDSLLDDLADRTFTINMAPAGKKYPSPSASKTDWKSLRTRCVKLMLTHYKQVCELVEELGEEEGFRFGELWLPIHVMLKLVEAPEEELNSIKDYCERKFAQVKYELNGWDYELVYLVANNDMEEITAEDLLTNLCLNIGAGEDQPKPGKQWLGKAMKRLGLIREKKGGKHDKTIYVLERDHAIKLLGDNGIVGDNDLKD